MNLSDLEKQRKILLLKKSKGEATVEDLKQVSQGIGFDKQGRTFSGVRSQK
jgi:hypothetical protein